MIPNSFFTKITSCDKLESLSLQPGEKLDTFTFGSSKHSLKELNLEFYNAPRIESLNEIFECTKLKKLKISRISLIQPQFSTLRTFEKSVLRDLTLQDCGLADPSSLKFFTSFPKLEKIDISFNFFDSFPEKFSLGISKNTLLEITAKSCNFQDKNIIEALTDCYKLKVLKLSFSGGSEQIIKYSFGRSYDSLEELEIYCRCSNGLPWIDAIKQCSRLRKLDLIGFDLRKTTYTMFNCGKLRNSIVSLSLFNCRLNFPKVISVLANYYRLENLGINKEYFLKFNSNVNFRNLAYTLKSLDLNTTMCERKIPEDKIRKCFKFIILRKVLRR